MAPTRDNGGIPMNETSTIEAPTTKTTDSISEAASKKRGRPRLMDAEEEAFLRNLFGSEVRTQRGLHNVFYRQLAFGVLGKHDEFKWLCDPVKMERGDPDCWKASILVELGRIEDIQEMLNIAAEICELKPKTKAAILMVRGLRLGRDDLVMRGALLHDWTDTAST
jgi:hypothetical protein